MKKRSYDQYSGTNKRPDQGRAPDKRQRVNGPQTTMPNNSLARQAQRTGGWANPSRGGELKFLDVQAGPALTVSSLAFNVAANLLNGVANGSDASTRIGRRTTMKSLLFKYSVSMVTAGTGGACIRFLIVYDKQANAAAPVITDVLLQNEFLSPNNLSNRDRFVTLVDEVSAPVSQNGDQAVCNVIFKRFELESLFNAGSAGTIGDITSGSVYLFVAQSGNIAGGAPTIAYKTRIRYTDV